MKRWLTQIEERNKKIYERWQELRCGRLYVKECLGVLSQEFGLKEAYIRNIVYQERTEM